MCLFLSAYRERRAWRSTDGGSGQRRVFFSSCFVTCHLSNPPRIIMHGLQKRRVRGIRGGKLVSESFDLPPSKSPPGQGTGEVPNVIYSFIPAD